MPRLVAGGILKKLRLARQRAVMSLVLTASAAWFAVAILSQVKCGINKELAFLLLSVGGATPVAAISLTT